MEEKEMVHHPAHYQSSKGLEVWDVQEAFTENLTGIFASDTSNILKYACRWNDKGKPVEDIRKIIEYAQHLLKKVEEREKSKSETKA